MLYCMFTGMFCGILSPSTCNYLSSLGTFTIDPDTGEIDVVGVLDREHRANYSIDVRATDRDPVSPRHNSTVVEVEVLDVNDNAPVFKVDSYTVDLVEHSSVGKILLKVGMCSISLQ